MTSQELLVKLNDANERVEKRKNTIIKVCKFLNINAEDLLNEFYDSIISHNDLNYYSSKVAKEVVNQFVTEIERDYTKDYTDEEYDRMYNHNNKVSQLVDNLPKLFDLLKVRNNWQVKYDTQLNKENAPKIEILWNFLNDWEEKAYQYFIGECERYFNLKKNYEEAKKQFINSDRLKQELEQIQNNPYQMKYYRTIERAKDQLISKWKANYYSSITNLVQDITNIKCKYVYKDEYHFDYDYVPDTYTVDEEKLHKVLAEEKQAKYEDLCNRISNIVGEMKDFSNLKVGLNGDLNGIVIGSKGTAKVETIGAGGYNVGQIVNVKCGQVYHFRVLVHKIA